MGSYVQLTHTSQCSNGRESRTNAIENKLNWTILSVSFPMNVKTLNGTRIFIRLLQKYHFSYKFIVASGRSDVKHLIVGRKCLHLN